MKGELVKAIKAAVREKLGYGANAIEAYVIGSYSSDPDEDTDLGADNKVEIKNLEVKPGDRLDCYIYTRIDGDVQLDTNLEVALGDDLSILEVLSIEEVCARG